MVREIILRKINTRVQKSNVSKEMKISSENAVLVMDIAKRLAEITSDKSASYSKELHINAKLRDIMRSLEVF